MKMVSLYYYQEKQFAAARIACPHSPYISATCQYRLTVTATSRQIKGRRQTARTLPSCPK